MSYLRKLPTSLFQYICTFLIDFEPWWNRRSYPRPRFDIWIVFQKIGLFPKNLYVTFSKPYSKHLLCTFPFINVHSLRLSELHPCYLYILQQMTNLEYLSLDVNPNYHYDLSNLSQIQSLDLESFRFGSIAYFMNGHVHNMHITYPSQLKHLLLYGDIIYNIPIPIHIQSLLFTGMFRRSTEWALSPNLHQLLLYLTYVPPLHFYEHLHSITLDRCHWDQTITLPKHIMFLEIKEDREDIIKQYIQPLCNGLSSYVDLKTLKLDVWFLNYNFLETISNLEEVFLPMKMSQDVRILGYILRNTVNFHFYNLKSAEMQNKNELCAFNFVCPPEKCLLHTKTISVS